MSGPVIKVEGLGKEYVIGGREKIHESFRDMLGSSLAAPLRRLRKLSGQVETEERFWALKDVSFEVREGEVLGIIGRNGAGKSTLLKILSRITAPTEGYVKIRGRVASLLEVGTGFHPELTGRENIYLNGAMLGMGRAEIARKFDGIVAFADVGKFLDTPVKRYSSGMYVRLAFAVAAHLQSDILLIDEVLAVGDVEFQKKCLCRMGDAARSGRTVLFVSHNLGAISALCPKTIYFGEGRIKSLGATSDIIPEYLSRMLQSNAQSLEEFRHAGYGNQVVFQDLALKAEKQEIPFGHPITYSLCIRSKINAKDVSIGHSVFDFVSRSCVGTLITDQAFSMNAGEELTLTLIVPNLHLAPGRYYAGFSIGRGGKGSNRQDIDVVIGQPSFQVLPLSDGEDIISHWKRSWGTIVIKGAQLTIDSRSGTH